MFVVYLSVQVERKQAAQTSIDLLVLRMSSPGAPTEAGMVLSLFGVLNMYMRNIMRSFIHI